MPEERIELATEYGEAFAAEVAEFLIAMDRRSPAIPSAVAGSWDRWVAWAKLFEENRRGEER